ncbi:MAG: hypothetical protein WC250_02110 [Candidatus Paceibacterota bacterium]|jgi:hypothetical protein
MESSLLVNGTSVSFYWKCLTALKKLHNSNKVLVEENDEGVLSPIPKRDREKDDSYQVSAVAWPFIHNLGNLLRPDRNDEGRIEFGDHMNDEEIGELIKSATQVLNLL